VAGRASTCPALSRAYDAAAEAANQVSYGEGPRGSRVWTLLYGRAQEVVGPVGGFADGVRRGCCRFFRLSVDILQSTLRLLCLTLQLSFYVARGASESFFHLAAKALGVTDNTIFIHDLFLLGILRVRSSTVGADAGSLPPLETRTDDWD